MKDETRVEAHDEVMCGLMKSVLLHIKDNGRMVYDTYEKMGLEVYVLYGSIQPLSLIIRGMLLVKWISVFKEEGQALIAGEFMPDHIEHIHLPDLMSLLADMEAKEQQDEDNIKSES